MEKRDLFMVALAIIIVLFMAVFIKPMITGEEVMFLPRDNISEEIQPENETDGQNEDLTGLNLTTQNITEPDSLALIPLELPETPIPTPTAVPTWDRSRTTVTLESDQAYTPPRPYPTSVADERKMLIYSQIDGKSGGISNPVTIPYGYWELVYDVSLAKGLTEAEIESNTLTRTKEEALLRETKNSADVVSLSVVVPRFSITVLDNTTSEVIRTITPPGGLNPELWEDDNEDFKDPRPWKENFYRGGDFIFDVDSSFIDSYSIRIMIPDPNTGSYAGMGYAKEKTDALYPAFSQYQDLINADPYQEKYITNITSRLTPGSPDTKNWKENAHAVTLLTDRLNGAVIDSFQVRDEWIQGNKGTLAGDITWLIETNPVTVPATTTWTRDVNGVWQSDSLPVLPEAELIKNLVTRYQNAFNADYNSDTYAKSLYDLLTTTARNEYTDIQCDYAHEQGKCCPFRDPYCESGDVSCSSGEECSLLALYRAAVTNRLQNITISGFTVSDTIIRGNEGVLKAEISWDTDGTTKKTFEDIPVRKDDGWIWKLDAPILLRT
ncbi:MAG: hypothetical protein JXA44_08550 [Methanospirillaceae archaeon]|nr:hypothetical protein [Methanospirillaceae archaeon]